MSTSSISSLSSGYLQSILTSALQDAGLTASKNSNNPSVSDASLVAYQPDNSRVSRFAQVMIALQQLQQSDPTKYQQITQQIATNLQSAAQAAPTAGYRTAANQLNQLANDFTDASKRGQLPNIQDLAQAIGGHRHRHHHHHHFSDSGSSTGGTSAMSQFLSGLHPHPAQSNLDPMSIIFNALSNAGIDVSGFTGEPVAGKGA